MRKPLFVILAALALGACAPSAKAPDATVIAVSLPGPRLDGALNAKMVPALRESVVTARLTIDAHTDASVPRPASNVALCIDTSGSMEGRAIEDARKAALSFLDGLKPGDGFALVTFDSTVRVVVPATRLDSSTDIAKIRAAIGTIRARGTTAMTDGVRAAIQEVRTLYDATRVNRVVLVSDGVPNDSTQLRVLAQQAQTSGISLSAMGLGVDYDEVLMGDLAQTGGGRYKYIDDSSKIASYLGDELTRISRVSARSAYLDITPGPGVTVDGVIGLPTTQAGTGTVQVLIGDVSLGSHRDVFIKMHARGRRDGAPVELADVALHYVGSDGANHEERFFFGAHATVDDDTLAKNRDEAVERAAKEAQQAADALDAIRRAHDSDKNPTPNLNRIRGAGGLPPATILAPSAAAFDSPEPTKRAHEAALKTLLGE